MEETATEDNKVQNEIDRIIKAGYEEVKYFTMPDYPTDCLMAICRRRGKVFLVDYTGENIKEVFEADELRPDLGSITPATFRIGTKWGIVNSKGEILLDAIYDSIKQDANAFIFLTRNGKEGFIAGGHLIEPQFDSIQFGADNYIEVTLNGSRGYITDNDEFTADKSEAYYNYMMFV